LNISSPYGITHDDKGFYIFGTYDTDSLKYVFGFDFNWTYKTRFRLTGEVENETFTDLAGDGPTLWAITLGKDDDYFVLVNFTSDGEVFGVINVSHADMSDVGIGIDDTYFYIFGDENGIVKFYKTNFSDLSDDICLVSSDNAGCQDWHIEPLVVAGDKVYIMRQQRIGSPGFVSTDWENTKVEIYGTDGYYYGFFNLTETPEPYYTARYSGIDYLSNTFYFLYDDGVEPRIEARYDFTACSNECFNESSKCGGIMKNYVIPCVQDINDCWKWYQGDWICTLTGTCNTTQCTYGCEERWENHRIKKAYCKSASSCEDICEPNQVSCSEDSKYIKECEYRHVWQNFENEIIPVGGQCWTWEDDIDWEFCGFGECIEGHCVQSDKCTDGETKCLIYDDVIIAPHLVGTEYVMTCRDTDNDTYFEWDIYNTTFCQWGCNETIVNVTTDQSIAVCINSSGDFMNIKNTVYESSVWMELMFSDPISKYMLILVICIMIFSLFTFYGEWELGVFGICVIVTMGSLIGWMPFEVIIIGIIFSGIFIYNRVSGGA